MGCVLGLYDTLKLKLSPDIIRFLNCNSNIWTHFLKILMVIILVIDFRKKKRFEFGWQRLFSCRKKATRTVPKLSYGKILFQESLGICSSSINLDPKYKGDHKNSVFDFKALLLFQSFMEQTETLFSLLSFIYYAVKVSNFWNGHFKDMLRIQLFMFIFIFL